jgi:hypothetical protein
MKSLTEYLFESTRCSEAISNVCFVAMRPGSSLFGSSIQKRQTMTGTLLSIVLAGSTEHMFIVNV